MSDAPDHRGHYGYLGQYILCGTCGYMMGPPIGGPERYEPGKPFKWLAVCGNTVCPHVGIIYEVLPEAPAIVNMRRYENAHT